MEILTQKTICRQKKNGGEIERKLMIGESVQFFIDLSVKKHQVRYKKKSLIAFLFMSHFIPIGIG